MKGHRIVDFLRAGQPLLWIQTHELERCIKHIKESYTTRPLHQWDSVRGCEVLGPEAKEPFQFVQKLGDPKTVKSAVVCAVNMHLYLDHQQFRQVIQALKNNVLNFKTQDISLVVVSPVVNIPVELERDFVLLEYALPTEEELESILQRVEGFTKSPNNVDGYQVPEDKRPLVVQSARGLTEREAEDAFSLSYVLNKEIQFEDVGRIKAQMVQKNNTLEFGDYKETFDTLGGLENVKEWCINRFQNRNKKLPFRGILMLGVPGTGKSHFAKALGNFVGWPVLSLNMGKVFSEFVGSSERNMRDALAVVDAMSPVILFIDEIEKGLAGTGGISTDSGVSKKVGGTFLQWLQDHESEVFVIATCNSIDELPAEYTRIGRWDGIFFVDLPTETEAKQIFNIYTNKYFPETKGIKMPKLDNYSGAEIRQTVIEAAYNGGDFNKASQFVVPLYRSHSDSIKALRERASKCWVSASKKEASIEDKLGATVRRLDA